LIDKDQWEVVASREDQMRNELNGFAEEYESKERTDQKAEKVTKRREAKSTKKGKKK
jgi:hypothetical protein